MCKCKWIGRVQEGWMAGGRRQVLCRRLFLLSSLVGSRFIPMAT